MLTIAVVNSKGGVGKTTLAASLAVRAARDYDRVAVVDMDPQKSAIDWWSRRGRTDNPTVFQAPDTAADAVESLQLNGWDVVFFDTPPAFVAIMEEVIDASDFVLIPVKPSMIDLIGTQDAVVRARGIGTDFLVVLNDCGPREKVAESARAFLLNHDVPIAETQIAHRVSHITGMTVGKSASEVDGGRDKAAASEIDRLWAEVKAAAIKAARAREHEASQ